MIDLRLFMGYIFVHFFLLQCTMEGLDIAFQPRPPPSGNSAQNDEVYAQVCTYKVHCFNIFSEVGECLSLEFQDFTLANCQICLFWDFCLYFGTHVPVHDMCMCTGLSHLCLFMYSL